MQTVEIIVRKLKGICFHSRTYRGRAHLKEKQYKNAAEDFCAAIHLNPRNWLAYYYRGCILRKIDPKQALQDFSISGTILFHVQAKLLE